MRISSSLALRGAPLRRTTTFRRSLFIDQAEPLDELPLADFAATHGADHTRPHAGPTPCTETIPG